jgi:hypothetical protein
MDQAALRVGFNARFLSHGNLRGLSRYTISLLAQLPARGIRPVLFSQCPVLAKYLELLPAGSYDTVVAGPSRILVWEQWWLPKQIQREGLQLFHSTSNFGLPVRGLFKKVLTLHDAIDYVYYYPQRTWGELLRLSTAISDFMSISSRRVADHIITVSEHARQDIIKTFKVSPDRVSVTYEAADANAIYRQLLQGHP